MNFCTGGVWLASPIGADRGWAGGRGRDVGGCPAGGWLGGAAGGWGADQGPHWAGWPL